MLTYEYTANQLIAVTDAVNTDQDYDFYDHGSKAISGEFLYDDNDNLKTDANKGNVDVT